MLKEEFTFNGELDLEVMSDDLEDQIADEIKKRFPNDDPDEFTWAAQLIITVSRI